MLGRPSAPRPATRLRAPVTPAMGQVSFPKKKKPKKKQASHSTPYPHPYPSLHRPEPGPPTPHWSPVHIQSSVINGWYHHLQPNVSWARPGSCVSNPTIDQHPQPCRGSFQVISFLPAIGFARDNQLCRHWAVDSVILRRARRGARLGLRDSTWWGGVRRKR